LELMDNLSQRHIRARMLRQVAGHIEASLRATDFMGRLTDSAFAMLIVDSPAGVVPAVAERVQQELNGTVVEDGVGGLVELAVSLGHAELLPTTHTSVVLLNWLRCYSRRAFLPQIVLWGPLARTGQT
jgi:GGDEF domain-containing protein